MIGAYRVQGRPLDDVIRVNAGKLRPIEIAQVRLIPSGQQNNAVDAPRLQDGIESLHRNARVTHGKTLDLETEFGGAGFGAGEEFLVITCRVVRPARLVEIDRRSTPRNAEPRERRNSDISAPASGLRR
jgi:hypothetical protein